MKIILSRKGFDSGYGGCASPIFPDESMASFPIPEEVSRHKMGLLSCGKRKYNLGVVARDLTPTNAEHPLGSTQTIHLDPYLRCNSANQPLGWTPAFGQDGAAQSHLDKQKVAPGDLFLFFGWFRKVEQINGQGPWTFVPNTPDLHVIFGWLQVGKVLKVSDYQNWRASFPWLDEHPHVRNATSYPQNNTIYVASPELHIGGKHIGLPGGGAFDEYFAALRLTHPESWRRSIWQLPHWFFPSASTEIPTMTYHTNNARWAVEAKYPKKVKLRSVAKGQEFVLSGADQLQACDWLRQLFMRASV